MSLLFKIDVPTSQFPKSLYQPKLPTAQCPYFSMSLNSYMYVLTSQCLYPQSPYNPTTFPFILSSYLPMPLLPNVPKCPFF